MGSLIPDLFPYILLYKIPIKDLLKTRNHLEISEIPNSCCASLHYFIQNSRLKNIFKLENMWKSVRPLILIMFPYIEVYTPLVKILF